MFTSTARSEHNCFMFHSHSPALNIRRMSRQEILHFGYLAGT